MTRVVSGRNVTVTLPVIAVTVTFQITGNYPTNQQIWNLLQAKYLKSRIKYAMLNLYLIHMAD
jgi:hypothetical protein